MSARKKTAVELAADFIKGPQQLGMKPKEILKRYSSREIYQAALRAGMKPPLRVLQGGRLW
jgi:hypothetical protein